MLRIASFLAVVSFALPMAAQPGMGRGWRCLAGVQAQPNSRAPIASNPVVEIGGVIAQVQISPGQGAPYLEVKTSDAETTKVFLGPIHYLIAENFNPKTGQEVSVKGYKLADSVIGIQVTLTKEKKVLSLRDDNGWPLWRGGAWRRGEGRMMGGRWSLPR